MVKKFIFILAVLFCGCSSIEKNKEYSERPERPVLPKIYKEELECLDKETYRKISMRDAMRRWYSEELEAIIDGAGN